MNNDSTDKTLIFKNIPKQIEDVTEFLQNLKIPAKEIKTFGRKRVLINYELKSEAEDALNILRELEFAGKPANVSFFRKEKPKENKEENFKPIAKKNRGVQTTDGTPQENILKPQQISTYVKKLYATQGDLGFDQPPPPYLKYSYPPINKDILDNICISLLSNKRFYTQVLHLMNRMNLDPPFTERKYKFTQPGIPQEAGTQTETVIIKESTTLLKNSSPEMEVDESELESSEEDERKRSRTQVQTKRKLPPQPEQYKKKAKQILQATQKLSKETSRKPTTTNLSIKEIFETPTSNEIAKPKIDLHLRRHHKAAQGLKLISNIPVDLNAQKLSLAELESLPIYKNYQEGQASNKLYIKNLHKDVTVDDLKLIYERFIINTSAKLDIKLMQHGRMKGQAFVTFNCSPMEFVQTIVAKALEETNGFLLRDKPMVVCYGKQS